MCNASTRRSPVQTPRGAKSPPTKRAKKETGETTPIFESPPDRRSANSVGSETQIPQQGGPQGGVTPTCQIHCTHENSSNFLQKTTLTSDPEPGQYTELTPVEHNAFSAPFMPSRGRSLEANLEATIAGLQRSGSALPRLVTANNTEEHLTRASQADPYHSALMARVTTCLWKSLRHTLDKYDTLQQSREHKLSELKTLAEQLEGKRVEWSQQLEAAIRPVVGHLHLPLLSALADRNGIDCKSTLSAISEGFRLTGEAPEAGNLAWKPNSQQTHQSPHPAKSGTST